MNVLTQSCWKSVTGYADIKQNDLIVRIKLPKMRSSHTFLNTYKKYKQKLHQVKYYGREWAQNF